MFIHREEVFGYLREFYKPESFDKICQDLEIGPTYNLELHMEDLFLDLEPKFDKDFIPEKLVVLKQMEQE